MNIQILKTTAAAMVKKGIVAMDESNATCKKRFDSIRVECNIENRRRYRSLLATTPELGDYISGAILFDETLRDHTVDGIAFPEQLAKQGIVPGIKVDGGAKDLAGHPGEKITEGLDGLRDRLAEYAGLGAKFTKWRAVITIGENIPSRACLVANTHALARYAALCQEADLVPIVEPEVLIDGSHSIDRCAAVTRATQALLFEQLAEQGVALEGLVLKPSMVISGLNATHRADVEAVAKATVGCLLENVPAEVAGVAFLSGGQSDMEASAHLSYMHNLDVDLPWPLTFSYSRALQNAALATWAGNDANITAAQNEFLHRAKMNVAAACGEYTEDLEEAA